MKYLLALVLALALLPLAPTPVSHAAASSGCGTPAVVGTVTQTLSYAGVTRTYLLHIPAVYTATVPLPLVLNLPGAGMAPALEEAVTHLSTTADQQGFIVAYPEGVGLAWNSGGSATGPDDVGFLTSLVTTLESTYCIDTSRVGVSGFSLGATMVYHLACSNLPWLTSIVSVAGTLPQFPQTCHIAHATPLLEIHGAQDPVVPYAGYPYGLSIPQVVEWWAYGNGCSLTPARVQAADVITATFSGCASGADTVLTAVTDGGHQWPGGWALPGLGYCSDAIDASALVGSFVLSHPLLSG